MTRRDLACCLQLFISDDLYLRVQATGNMAMTSHRSILAVLPVCWRSCTEPEVFCSCLTLHFLRGDANWWLGFVWFVLCLFVVLVVFCVVCCCLFGWITLALLYQDRGFLNTVPIFVIKMTATKG